ncbi:MAG: hypothetical protein ACI9T9_002163 [Oleiphilaceae bacterium]|jgi:hypothetical protein
MTLIGDYSFMSCVLNNKNIEEENHIDQPLKLVSNVLVLDGSEEAYGVLKVFFQQNHLVGFRASPESVNEMLKSNMYFGAILISEESISSNIDSIELSHHIHINRPDLPIFLRRYDSNNLEGIPEKYQEMFAGAYCLSNLESLKTLVHEQIFEDFYPADLVAGIQAVSEVCIKSGFTGVEVQSDTPFLVHDKLMEDFNSLISLESKWCRGYMMLQVGKARIVDYLRANKTGVAVSEITDQDANTVISNLTNEIWGAIRREFIGYGNELEAEASRIQVPLFINPDNRYISFGTSKPQLCYRYRIVDNSGVLPPLVITQKLIFNLDWSPENFELSEQMVDEFIEVGDLEMF